MIHMFMQHTEGYGDLGGNRTRDNLIKSLVPSFNNHGLARNIIVKPSMAGQWVREELSNLKGFAMHKALWYYYSSPEEEYMDHKEFSRKGGKSRSEKKMAAVNKNMQKALKALKAKREAKKNAQ